MAQVTTARAAALPSAARIVPRWLPYERASLRGRMAQRTAPSDRSTAATSVTLWPASASRPVEWAIRPATTWPTTRAMLSVSATPSRADRVTARSLARRPLARRRPHLRRPIAPTHRHGQVRLDQREVAGVRHPDAATLGPHDAEAHGPVAHRP